MAELLIVVAIIIVLAAIAIPLFSRFMEESREATDLANVRSAYAEVLAAAQSQDRSRLFDESTNTYSLSVPLEQRKRDWQGDVAPIGGVSEGDTEHWVGTPDAEGVCVITCDGSNQPVINWGGSTYQVGYSWTYDGSARLGGILKIGQIKDWSCRTTAVEQAFSAKAGESKFVIAGTNDPDLAGYAIGFYAVDSNNTIVYNSGERALGSGTQSIRIIDALGSGAKDLNVYVQLIGPKGTTDGVPPKLADKIMSLLSVQ